jgi:hypothetical protein
MAADIEDRVWFRLLTEWRNRGRRGLTLPFLTGAVLRQQGKAAGTRSDIWALLNEIGSQDDDQWIILFGWCADLQSPLLHKEYAEHRMSTDLYEPADGFLVIEKSLCRYMRLPDLDKEALLTTLVKQAVKPVSEGRYSLKRIAEQWEYVPFDQEDLHLIDKATQHS